MWRMTLLGGLQFDLDDTTLTGFISAKAQALLCYLAVTRRAQRRDTLCGLLWGDKPDADARLSLRVALSNLRQLLAPYLIIGREAAAFNRQSEYWLDVEILQSQVQSQGGALSAQELAQLRETEKLYRGDFLEGFFVRDAPAFEEWAQGQRARYRHLALQAIYRLAAYYGAQREYGLALDYTSRLVTLEPWQEEAHRLMMQLLSDSGQPSAALAQYETCRRMLAEEFGLQPSDETRALYQLIRTAR